MVVDALDLCYTKAHVDTFVIISGDSDFSPLVSKLRENNKTVIGVGTRNSSSDLLIANCDEFIHYDDIAGVQRQRERARPAAKPAVRSAVSARNAAPAAPAAADDAKRAAWELVLSTYEALVEERGEEEKIWGSMIKQALKRRNPGFSEARHGFRSFGQLLEEAEAAGIFKLEPDAKSGGVVVTGVQRG
jgi:hypothetical protein